MTWRGTVLVLLAGILSVALLFVTLRTRTREAGAPLLGIIPGETTGIVITAAGSSTTLENRGGIWWITKPVLDRADPAKVSKLLEAASDVVPLDKLRPADLKGPLSLESLDLRPLKRSLVFHGAGNHTLKLGSEGATPERLYAQIDSDPSVYLISSETAALGFKPVNELRDPSTFALNSDRLSEIVIRQQGGYRELKLLKKGRNWSIVSPFSACADGEAVQKWVSSLLSSRILRWMPNETESAACGLDDPQTVVTLRSQDGEANSMELGKVVDGTSDDRFARISGRPGIFVLGSVGAWHEVTPSSMRLNHPSAVEYDSVDRIMITRGEQSVVLSRKPRTDDWLCEERIIPGTVVSNWFGSLQGATASSFEAATPQHLSYRGIDPATSETISIRFVARLSENSAEEAAGDMTLAEWTIGAPSSDGMIALHELNADDLMIFPSVTIVPLLEEAVGWKTPPSPPLPTSISTGR